MGHDLWMMILEGTVSKRQSLFLYIAPCLVPNNQAQYTMQEKLIKIAIVGPESTGKSIMTETLAAHFDTVCVPEYARQYCEGLDRKYTLEDELAIFHGQQALEQSMIPRARHNLLFCDTMILTVKIWCDHLFGYTPQVVLDALQKADYDLYLLMDIDLPWQDDPLRDFPEDREYFMDIWLRELQSLGVSYEIISGLGDQRLKNALAAIRQNR